MHCGHKEKGGFNGKGQLIQHLNENNKCRKMRGLQFLTDRNACGDKTVHYVNSPRFKVDGKNKKGETVNMFKCPTCKETVNYDHRWKHVRKCFPQHNRSIAK